jgi:hypothetical protein
MAVVSMSKGEFSQLEVLLQVQSGSLRVAECELIGLHRRQVFRLLRGLKQDGATSVCRSAAARSRRCSPARSSTTSGCRRCWSWSRRSKPPTRRVSSEGTLRASDRRTTSRRRVCRPRAGPLATLPPRLRLGSPAWRADPLCIPLPNGNPTRQAAPSRRGWGGFFRGRRSTPKLGVMVAQQPPSGGSRPVPIGPRSIRPCPPRL